MAASAARAAAGDYTGLAAQLIRWIKPILSIIGSLILVIVLLISMPFTLLGKLFNPDASSEYGAFFDSELANAVRYTSELSQKEEQRFKAAEQQSKNSTIFDEHYTWDAVSDIDLNISEEDLLIIYSVLFDEYDGKPIDFTKLDFLGELAVIRSSEITTTYSTEIDDDGNEYTITHYLFTYTARLMPFEDMLSTLGLDELQQSRAMVMYNYLNNQDQSSTYGNDTAGLELGNITYSDGAVDVVYFSQYDIRWKNTAYGKTGTMGRSACGPTSLAMVISSLSGQTVLPTEVASWSASNGYYVEGNGSMHSLIPNGARHWGVPVQGVGYKWQSVVDALANGKLVIAIMGKGNFTGGGHYIVLRGVTSDGKILVADSASTKRSEQLWDASVIVSEARKGAGAGGAFWVLG